MATPMMIQYNQIKEKYKGAILFFRLGDFYEMFDTDAIQVSELLDLTLTHRHGTPMCGIPHHASLAYIKRLLELGQKVAVCEQISVPGSVGKIVEREVTEVYTPGMVIEDELLETRTNNFLMVAHVISSRAQIAYVDYSTGYLGVSYATSQGASEFLRREIQRLSPQEVLLEEGLYDDPVLRSWLSSHTKRVASLPGWYFDSARTLEAILGHFKVSHLNALGFSEGEMHYLPLGVLLIYLCENKAVISHLKHLSLYTGENSLFMDEATIRNLELVCNMREGDREFSLLKVIDNTKTGMGVRLLHQWVLSPSSSQREIEQRLCAVSEFVKRPALMKEMRILLGQVKDLERLAVRLSLNKAHARDILLIAQTLGKVGELQGVLIRERLQTLTFIDAERAEKLKDLHRQIVKTIHNEPSTTFTTGNLIILGFNEQLDTLRDLEINGKVRLQEVLYREKAATGMSALKIKYNKMIGYHFEVPKSQSDMAPEYFHKRQTFLTGDRFTTEELGELEQDIVTAGDRALALEREFFFTFRDSIKGFVPLLREVADFLGLWDIYTNLAYVALEQDFVRPTIKEKGAGLQIIKGRHPVVEYCAKSGSFVANDLSLTKESGYFSFITGPNMAGKSTYLRQIALITLIAQIGSYVPAESAILGIVDKIFCRVGASDNLARGESTFLVEMNETSFILRHATPNSLVILDEVGRGTSTYDGLAIAWAVSEYLLNSAKSFTLFATHYHELAELSDPRIQHLSLAVRVKGDDITFLRRIEAKPSLSSYGIAVAKLAGVPSAVIARAKELLLHLEAGHPSKRAMPESSGVISPEGFEEGLDLKGELDGLDVNTLTPLDALSLLSKWKRQWGN